MTPLSALLAESLTSQSQFTRKAWQCSLWRSQTGTLNTRFFPSRAQPQRYKVRGNVTGEFLRPIKGSAWVATWRCQHCHTQYGSNIQREKGNLPMSKTNNTTPQLSQRFGKIAASSENYGELDFLSIMRSFRIMSWVSEASWVRECIQRKIPGGLQLQLDSTTLLLSQTLIPPTSSLKKADSYRFLGPQFPPLLSDFLPASISCLGDGRPTLHLQVFLWRGLGYVWNVFLFLCNNGIKVAASSNLYLTVHKRVPKNIQGFHACPC